MQSCKLWLIHECAQQQPEVQACNETDNRRGGLIIGQEAGETLTGVRQIVSPIIRGTAVEPDVVRTLINVVAGESEPEVGCINTYSAKNKMFLLLQIDAYTE